MAQSVKLFLAGDVMTGRGIDQLMPRSSRPVLHESYVRDARRYVELAESLNGPIEQPVDPAYIWGDVLGVVDAFSPDLRIVNLETSVTRSNDYWRWKGIHYRMHPENVACLTAAAIDCCVLANNHVLDWGFSGLEDTLSALRSAGLQTAGAGESIERSRAPAIFEVGSGNRVLVFAYGAVSSGIPAAWAVRSGSSGVNLLPDLPQRAAAEIAEAVAEYRTPRDLVVVSVHWGGNWGYDIPNEQRELAHALVEHAGVDIVHGHSSHHAKAVEIHRGSPIFYGCGDFVNDYEGISGHEQFRGDLRLAWFATVDAAGGGLQRLSVVPFQTHRLRLRGASADDLEFVRGMLERECARFGVRIESSHGGSIEISAGRDGW